MGVHKLMLLTVVLVCFCSHTSFAQVNENLVPGNTHQNTEGNKIDENDAAISGGTRKVNKSKYTTALARGGSGVHPTGDGGNGVLPVYGAGAGGQLRKHKSSASTYTPCGFVVFIATTLASLLLDGQMY